MNSLSKTAVIACAVTLLFGCDNRPDKTLSPSEGAKWVDVTFRVPSTPNACAFYERNGFTLIEETQYPSKLAGTSLRCMDMVCVLDG